MFTSTASSISKMSALVSGVGTDASIYDDPQDGDIPALLDSRYDADKAQGLKRLIALIAQSQDVSNFFPQVVKGVASQSLEVKKLVYIYLVHYADKRPDEALLSINSFQKDLSDQNPVVRAWALRAMSGIKVRAIVPLVIIAANKCARDPSPYVRKCAANAVSKIHSMGDEQHAEALVELVSILLNDNSPEVAGAAAGAFISVCPENFSLLSSNFRKLCGFLPAADAWGQVSLMDILMRYLVAVHGIVRQFSSTDSENDLLLVDPQQIPSSGKCWDLRLMLSSTKPLLQSLNGSVVLQAATVHWYFSPSEELSCIVKPLLFLLRASHSSQQVVLSNILSFSRCFPGLFEPSYEEFFVRSCDSQAIRALKLDILTNIVTDSSVNHILQELEAYVRSSNSQFSSDAVSSIGRCALRLSSTTSLCTRGLLSLITASNSQGDDEKISFGVSKTSEAGKNSGRGRVVVQAILALRAIVQKHPEEKDQVMVHFLHNLDRITEPSAREVIIWMIGEHGLSSPAINKLMPTILQYLAKTFVDESDGTKLQILCCISKVIMNSTWNSSMKTTLLILQYVLNLASCDLSYDIRDRARMLRVFLVEHLRTSPDFTTDPLYTELVDAVNSKLQKMPRTPSVLISAVARSGLLSPKPVPVLPALSFEKTSFLPGSMSHLVLHMSPGFRPLSRGLQNEETRSSSGDDDDSGEYSYSGNTTSSSSNRKQNSNSEQGSSSSSEENEDFKASGRGDLISLSDDEASKVAGASDKTRDDEFESWLGAPETSTSSASAECFPFGVPEFEPKKFLTLDFTNGDGLEAQYSFTRSSSRTSSTFVSLCLFLHNKSLETISGISVGDEASSENGSGFECGNARVMPPTTIPAIEPGEKTECELQIDFRHNLNPIKMWLHFNEKKVPMKITPEPGVFLRPRQMTLDSFRFAESQISGMHRSSRRIRMRSKSSEEAQLLCKAIISSANVAVVGVSLQEMLLRFSGETISGSLLCLISLSQEPDSSHGTLKVSCEDTLFGLALLNQLDKSLATLQV